MISLKEFRTEFMNSVSTRAEVDNTFTSEAFTAECCDRLNGMGEVENLTPVPHFEGVGQKRARLVLDAYDGDDSDRSICVAVTMYTADSESGALTTASVTEQFGRLEAFLRDAMDGSFLSDQEMSTPAYGVAKMIRERGRDISKFRLFLLTNQPAGANLRDLEPGILRLIPVEYNIWDLERFHRVASTSGGRVPLEIDLKRWAPEGVPTLQVDDHVQNLRTYLAAVPGTVLATLYGEYGSRLLEGNVRSFLSARGSVNRGIRNTLLNEPERFMAYNNGITATATRVDIDPNSGNLVGISDLQIVNGGQTTASLFYVGRESAAERGLDGVFVQMKLIEVSPDEAAEMVPQISRSANSQNKVSQADFFSNSPFHLRLEEISRRVLVPSQPGVRVQSKWFYERNRGQYQNELAKLSASERRLFETTYPRTQVITKTEAAQYLMAHAKRPHIVSQGAQKNFVAFAASVSSRWEQHNTEFNEKYFQDLVALAILYRSLRRAISRADWYDKGYLANLVAYAMARLSHAVDSKPGATMPLAAIWIEQSVPAPVLEGALLFAEDTLEVLTSPVREVDNVTEWAKRQAAWDMARARRVVLPDEFWNSLTPATDEAAAKGAAATKQRLDNEIQILQAIFDTQPEEWKELREFCARRRLLTSTEAGLLDRLASEKIAVPTERQVDAIVRLSRKAQRDGFNGAASF